MIIFLWSGCVSGLARIESASLSPHTVEYYKRTLTEFDRALFYKPAQNTHEDHEDITLMMAPLIIGQVIKPADHKLAQNSFGEVYVDAPGRVSIDTARPTIYTDITVTEIDGEPYDQILYVWWYETEYAQHPDDTLSLRGIRITLGKDGFPLVCEILDDDRVDLMFVSQSLERAAKKVYGPPLSGRLYSVEREVNDTPHTVVARILEDGPVPTGPYVYLQVESKAVTTLSCRCTPSQVSHIVESTYYDLMPLEALGSWGLQTVRHGIAYGDRLGLQRRLRWPAP